MKGLQLLLCVCVCVMWERTRFSSPSSCCYCSILQIFDLFVLHFISPSLPSLPPASRLLIPDAIFLTDATGGTGGVFERLVEFYCPDWKERRQKGISDLISCPAVSLSRSRLTLLFSTHQLALWSPSLCVCVHAKALCPLWRHTDWCCVCVCVHYPRHSGILLLLV